jgi:pimeloyl-ACP methyl ester carboxylesterase
LQAVNHGDSAAVNAENLGGLCKIFVDYSLRQRPMTEEVPDDWSDGSRDLLNLLSHYLPPIGCPDTPPVHLQRIEDTQASLRRSRGFDDRKLIVIGHSMGGVVSSVHAFLPDGFVTLTVLQSSCRVEFSEPLRCSYVG